VSPIDPEISVRGEEDRVAQRLGHSDQAGIREADRNVRVLVEQPEDRINVIAELKST
jgi:hypothetical protein